jgi:hypothetical protein
MLLSTLVVTILLGKSVGSKVLVQRVGLLFMGLVVGLLLAEIVLRIWTPGTLADKAVRRSDPIYHHSLRPSSSYIERTPEYVVEMKTNSMGLRGDEYVPGHEKEFKIVMLGDSFVEGFGVPEESCLVHWLEGRLNSTEDRGVKYVVFNFGVAGYSPILEYLLLRDRALLLDPQLVVLCYDMSDVQEDVLYAEDAVFDPMGVPVRVNPTSPKFGNLGLFPRGALQTFLKDHSYFYSLISAFAQTLKPHPLFELGNIHAGRFMHTVDSTSERWDIYFSESESYIKLITEMLRKRNIPFVLSVHPMGHQVNEIEWAEGRKYWGLESRRYNSAIMRSLEEFAERNSTPFLNMTETFRRQSKGDLYYPVDGHWTVRGNQVAADTLFQFLVDDHLVGIQLNSSDSSGARAFGLGLGGLK